VFLGGLEMTNLVWKLVYCSISEFHQFGIFSQVDPCGGFPVPWSSGSTPAGWTDGPMDRWTSGDVFGAARTWRMFCDCLGHHQRDQHWSRGAGGSAVEWRNGDFFGINFGDQHKNHDLGDVRPR
jgi:hypothetical protein